MKDLDEPRRLLQTEEVPAELRRWLGRAQEVVPSDAAVERLMQAVESRASAPPSATTPGQVARPSWAAHAARHPLNLIVVAAVAGAGAWYIGSTGTRNHGPSARVPQSSPRAPESPVPPPVSLPDRATPPVAVAPSPLRAPSRPAPASVAKPAFSARSYGAAPTRSARGFSGRARHDTAPGVQKAPEREPNPSTPGHLGEYRLLRSARQALVGDPAQALALAQEHARRFPRGMLAQEREAIAVEALVRLGRRREARARARGFFAAYPSSPYRSRIERLLEHAPDGTAPP